MSVLDVNIAKLSPWNISHFKTRNKKWKKRLWSQQFMTGLIQRSSSAQHNLRFYLHFSLIYFHFCRWVQENIFYIQHPESCAASTNKHSLSRIIQRVEIMSKFIFEAGAVIFMSGAIIQYHDQFVMHVLHQQFMILHPIWFIQKQIWSFVGFFSSQHLCIYSACWHCWRWSHLSNLKGLGWPARFACGFFVSLMAHFLD